MTSERLDFEDILDRIMDEEPLPTYEAMTRWSARYPHHAEELKEFFKAWAFEEADSASAEPVAIDQEDSVQRGVAFALELARKQGRIAPPQPAPQLENFDQVVLATICGLHADAHHFTIGQRAAALLDRHAIVGKLVLSLERLEKLGLIQGRNETSKRTEEKKRRYFTITLAGEHALAAVKVASPEIALFLREFA